MGAHWQDAVDMEAAPPGFDYNPSAWFRRVRFSLLAATAMLIAAWMSLYQFELIGGVWDPVFGEGSEKVLTSETARQMDRWLRVPDAALGAWGYMSEAVLALVGGTRRWQHRPWMVILFGIDVILLGGAGVLLVIMQGFVVGAWCTPCLITAAISLILVYMAYDEVWACMKYLWRVWKRTRSGAKVWRVFCGYPLDVAEEAALPRGAG